jgi:hypothetical protein
VDVLSRWLGVQCVPSNNIRFGVGGLLPDPNDAIIGKTDFCYVVEETLLLKFVTEMKTAFAFPLEEPWYRRTRAAQSGCALYYSQSPLLLCSPKAFKLLIEDDNRESIFGYPGGYYGGDPSGPDFIDVLGMLILSQRTFGPDAPPPKTPVKKEKKPIEKIDITPLQYGNASDRERPVLPRAAKVNSIGSGFTGSKALGDRDFSSTGREIFFLTPEELEEAFANDETPLFESAIVESQHTQEEAQRMETNLYQ